MHITELGSEYQWFGSVDIDNRTFASLESNYDLLAELDLQRSNNVFTGLGDFLYSKKTLIEVEGKTGSYDDYLVDLSPEGDMLKERAGNYDNGRTGYELPNVERYTVVNQYTGKDPFTLMKEVYTEIKAKTGSDVYFGFGPMNSDLLVRTQALEIEELFLEKSKEKEIPMIFFNAVTDGIMDEEYFFDTNYHLSTEGATVFTENIIYNMAYLLGYSL